MAQTYFGSTLRAGSGTLTDTVDGGFVVMSQTTTVTTAAAGTATSATLTLPASSQIISFFADMVVNEAVGGGTATAIAMTIGTAAAGTRLCMLRKFKEHDHGSIQANGQNGDHRAFY